ncbi:MAG: hypothetical protein M3Q75_04550, partial [Gemmatimonadota bacterium]|nr:hypothetical protein [Gemmatimonadota bacterium]
AGLVLDVVWHVLLVARDGCTARRARAVAVLVVVLVATIDGSAVTVRIVLVGGPGLLGIGLPVAGRLLVALRRVFAGVLRRGRVGPALLVGLLPTGVALGRRLGRVRGGRLGLLSLVVAQRAAPRGIVSPVLSHPRCSPP